jgi:hypothetical protein
MFDDEFSIPELRKEITKLERELLEATRALMNLEKQYKSDKMELLAKMETFEEKLKWLKAKLKPN